MFRFLLGVLLATSSVSAKYVATAAGSTCLTEGHANIAGVQACGEAAAAVGLPTTTAAVVHPSFQFVSTAGCFYETETEYAGLWFNPNVLSTTLNDRDVALCVAVDGVRETVQHIRFNGMESCLEKGELTITSAEGCQQAVDDLGMATSVALVQPGSYEYLAGCFVNLQSTVAYFNPAVISSARDVTTAPVCAKAGARSAVAPGPDGVGYVRMGGGAGCVAGGKGVVQTVGECEQAARLMELAVVDARNTTESDMSGRPPGCYYDVWSGSEALYFNPFLSSTGAFVHSAPICETVALPANGVFTQVPASARCSDGYRQITRAEDCREAAKSLGYADREAAPTRDPWAHAGGCYVQQTAVGDVPKGLYFNPQHSSSQTGLFDTTICTRVAGGAPDQPADEVAHVRLDYGASCNITSHGVVGTYEECVYAAKSMALNSDVVATPAAYVWGYPRGCYITSDQGDVVVNFNGDPYSTAVSVGAAPICRKDVPLSFEIDATLQGRAFYFGANGWGMTEKETKVLDRLPGRQGFRLIRWANLIPRPEETPPTGALTSEKGMRDLSDFVARQYKGRECAVKEYSGMLKNRGIEVLAVPFGVAAGYTQFYPKEQLNATDDVYIMKSEHIADWAAYLAECVWFVTTQLDVPIRYLELVNEPDGSWDTYLTPTQYVALLTKTDLALRSRSVTQTEIAGPAVAGLVSGLTCQDMNGVFLEKCYLEELTTTAGASAMLGAVSVHPWDDVYNLEHRPVSFLDEQFARFTRKKEEVRLGEKKFIVSEWGGLNMVTMNLGGQRFNTTAAECYVQPTGSDNEKRESNIAVSPLWAVRAFANLLILINNGVEDALYWMLHDIEWSRGCLGLYDRAGEPSVAMEAFEPFFKLWPSKPARAVTRAWANGVDGKTEDVVVAALTDGCRVLVAAVNTKDAAETFTLKVNGMSDRARTQAVETYNNNNLVPEVVPGAALQVTLASYGMLVFAIDEPGCSGDTEWYTTPSAAHDANVVPMVMVWAALLAVGVAGGCYTSKKARDADKTPAGSDQSSQPNDTRNTTPAAPGDSEGTDAFVLRMPLNSEESDGVRKPVNHAAAASRSLALVVGLDVVFHVVALTQGFSAPARFSFYGADLRELGRLVEDAYVLHAARVFVLLLLWRLHSTAVIHAATWFSYYRPAALAVAFFLAAKVRVRLAHALDEVCWFDLDVQTRVKPVPDPWFWTAIAQGLLFAGVELALVWYLKRGEEAGDAPAASLRPAAAAAAPKKANLDALSSLRFFAALHIVVYHFHASGSRTWNVFASWGASHLTFFFMLSGFVLSYQYGDRTIRQTDFWIKRAIRLYPVYILSCLVGVLVMDSALFKWSDTVFVFLSVQKWTGPAINYINTPGWAVGPFLLMYAIFPTLRDIILTVSRQKRVTVLLPLVYITGMMAAGDALGENWTGVFAPLNHVFLSAHFPSFLYGVVSGLNYLERSKEGRFSLVTFSDVVATPAILTALLALFCLVDLSQEHGDQPFWHEWARFGMLQPVFGALIWYSSRGHDFASKILGADTVVFFGRYSFTIYLLQAPLFMAAQRYFGMPYPTEDWACGAFLYALIAASILVCEYFEAPVGKLLQHAWTTVLSPNLPNLLNLVPEVPLVLCVVGYYAMMAGIFLMFASLAVFGTSTVLQWEGDSYMFDLTDSGIFDTVVTVIKWMALASLPVAVVGLAGQILFPPVLKRKVPTLKQMLDDTLPGVPHFTHRLHFRIVTRGKAPLLVLENVETAARVLESCLPRNKYEIEVVTDNDMQLQTRTATPVTEIVVPTAYATPTGAKFKARALEYAIHNSSCTREDWIVHQDEETRFDVETVRHVYYHCAAEQQAVAEGKRRYGRIGQGIIYYGINDEIENWVTTLADSIRVADDFGKFRIQFALHEPLIGMHGSFVVASHAVEQATTFDHGMLGSVTEDAYFALVARSLGVTFSHIDARMYEQSPFSIVDFAKQRKRWFAGLWLVAKAPLIPFKYRLGLLLLEIQWGWAPFMLPAALLVLTCKTNTSVGFKLVLALVSAYWCWAYVVGFLFTFSIRKLGVAKYCVLLWLQLVLQPLFALMEVWGVGWALVDREAFKGFHVVDKQSAALKARMEGRDAVQDTEMKPVSEGEESLLEKNAAAHRTDNRTKELTVAN